MDIATIVIENAADLTKRQLLDEVRRRLNPEYQIVACDSTSRHPNAHVTVVTERRDVGVR